MARFTVTLGEMELSISDWSPWLSRWRMRVWEQSAHNLIERITVDLGELVSTTEIAHDDDDEECDDEDCDCKAAPRPNIGFRSKVGD